MLHTQVNLKAYGNKPINVIGQVNCNIEFHGKKSTQLFYVVKSTKVGKRVNNLCGRDLISKVGLFVGGTNPALKVNSIYQGFSLEDYKIDENKALPEKPVLSKPSVAENNSYWRRDSRTLAAAEKRGLNVPDNCELKCQLKYYEIKFSCVKGGREIKYNVSNTVLTFVNDNLTFRAGCQSFIQVTYSKERHKLVIVNLNLEHNHAVNLSFRINTMNENLMYTVKRCNIDKIAVQKHLKSKLVIENVNKTIKITYGCRGHVTSLFLSKGYQSDKCAKK
ncbi:hypothetical protein GQR58_022513 [Nymphon striatum]|nr:hypothetical protein GQR58_022513 [Nymphon striatum]